MTRLQAVILAADLNAEQQAFIDNAIRGAKGNLIVLEGLPSTGKIKKLAILIVVLLVLGFKIVATAHSNDGVNEVYAKVHALIQQHRLAGLEQVCIRLHGPGKEDQLSNELEFGIKRVHSGCLAKRIHDFTTRQPRSSAMEEYCAHLKARFFSGPGAGKPKDCKMDFETARTVVRAQVVSNMRFIAATTFVASKLAEEKMPFQADVEILDEAAQAPEPDAVSTIVAQEKLQLLVLCGDTEQLGPVVLSHQGQGNPLSGLLIKSLMTRLTAAQPHITTHRLKVNYRSHEKLIKMPSKLFYNDEMVAAQIRPPSRVAENIKEALRDRNVFGAIYLNKINQDNRQFFFNVDGEAVTEPHGSSSSNPAGRAAIVPFVEHLVVTAQVPQGEIGIISMYTDDVSRMRNELAEIQLQDVEVATVDSFQGREKTVMIVHFVAAFPRRHNPFGFVHNSNRLCVATTRAKEFQFLFGYFAFWEQKLEEMQRRVTRAVGPGAKRVAAEANKEYDSQGKLRGMMEFMKEHDLGVDWDGVRLPTGR